MGKIQPFLNYTASQAEGEEMGICFISISIPSEW